MHTKFPIDSKLIDSLHFRAQAYGYDPKDRNTVVVPANCCEVLLLAEYPQLKDLWKGFKTKLTAIYDKMTDREGKGAPTKSWLELDARYCMAIFSLSGLDEVKKYLINELNTYKKG